MQMSLRDCEVLSNIGFSGLADRKPYTWKMLAYITVIMNTGNAYMYFQVFLELQLQPSFPEYQQSSN